MRVTFITTLLTLALFGLLAPKTSLHPTAILVGGEYTVQTGEIRSGDMLLLLARVKIAEGGQVQGSIHLLGSALVVQGQVNGDVHAYSSEVSLEGSAQVDGVVNTTGSLRGLPFLPSILLIIS